MVLKHIVYVINSVSFFYAWLICTRLLKMILLFVLSFVQWYVKSDTKCDIGIMIQILTHYLFGCTLVHTYSTYKELFEVTVIQTLESTWTGDYSSPCSAVTEILNKFDFVSYFQQCIVVKGSNRSPLAVILCSQDPFVSFVWYLLIFKLGGSRLTYWDLDVSSFFLSFSQFASSSSCLIRFLPNLVKSMYGWMATKLMGLKIHQGSFGVTVIKNVNHVKNMKTAPIRNLMVSSCRQ